MELTIPFAFAIATLAASFVALATVPTDASTTTVIITMVLAITTSVLYFVSGNIGMGIVWAVIALFWIFNSIVKIHRA